MYRRIINYVIIAVALFTAYTYSASDETSQQFKKVTDPLTQIVDEFRASVGLVEPVDRSVRAELADVDAADVTDAVVSIKVYEDVPLFESRYYRNQERAPVPPLDRIEIRQNIGSGSGFFFSQDGYLITNKHVVSNTDAEFTAVFDSGKESEALVAYRDPVYDLAILKVEGDEFPTIDLGDSSALSIGQKVTSIGNAYGEVLDSKSFGKVSGLDRDVYVTGPDGEAEQLRDLIQTSAALYPGDSGGPLLNESNEAVGVNVASAIGDHMGFSIPINIAKSVIQRAGVNVSSP